MGPPVERVRAGFGDLGFIVGADAPRPLSGFADPYDAIVVQCRQIEALLPKVDRILEGGLYDWAADPAGYDHPQEAGAQLLVLGALSEQDPKHPALEGHRPIAVRLADGPNFSASCVRSADVDYIVVGSAHFQLLRQVAHVIIELCDGRSPRSPSGNPTPFAQPLRDLLQADPSRVVKLMRPIAQFVIASDAGNTPPPSPNLAERLAGDELAPEVRGCVLDLYTGSDGFVVLHELAHLLNGDAMGQHRSFELEFQADRGALSLALAAFTGLRSVGATHAAAMALNTVRCGAAATIQLYRCFNLILAGHRLAAQLADRALSRWDGDIASEFAAADELEARLAGIAVIVTEFGLGEIAHEVPRLIRDYDGLMTATRAFELSAGGDLDAISRLGWLRPDPNPLPIPGR